LLTRKLFLVESSISRYWRITNQLKLNTSALTTRNSRRHSMPAWSPLSILSHSW
jgi:hypothetical protein